MCRFGRSCSVCTRRIRASLNRQTFHFRIWLCLIFLPRKMPTSSFLQRLSNRLSMQSTASDSLSCWRSTLIPLCFWTVSWLVPRVWSCSASLVLSAVGWCIWTRTLGKAESGMIESTEILVARTSATRRSKWRINQFTNHLLCFHAVHWSWTQLSYSESHYTRGWWLGPILHVCFVVCLLVFAPCAWVPGCLKWEIFDFNTSKSRSGGRPGDCQWKRGRDVGITAMAVLCPRESAFNTLDLFLCAVIRSGYLFMCDPHFHFPFLSTKGLPIGPKNQTLPVRFDDCWNALAWFPLCFSAQARIVPNISNMKSHSFSGLTSTLKLSNDTTPHHSCCSSTFWSTSLSKSIERSGFFNPCWALLTVEIEWEQTKMINDVYHISSLLRTQLENVALAGCEEPY